GHPQPGVQESVGQRHRRDPRSISSASETGVARQERVAGNGSEAAHCGHSGVAVIGSSLRVRET
ncbi:MAG: hypothetical protein ACJ72A_21060, partial [Nocardioidaceae bacterium]